MDETTLTGRLPGLDIEVTRRQSADGAAEIVAISLRAQPDLAHAAQRLMPALLMAGNSAMAPGFMAWMPWAYWLQAAAQMPPWPWLAPWMAESQKIDETDRAAGR